MEKSSPDDEDYNQISSGPELSHVAICFLPCFSCNVSGLIHQVIYKFTRAAAKFTKLLAPVASGVCDISSKFVTLVSLSEQNASDNAYSSESQ